MSAMKSILVANRGEIAVRIMRTVKQLGYRTIAVYSDADRLAPHARVADEAVHIGASPVGASYLNGERIIAAAKDSGADAIHPGYGFLSENAEFARACEAAGLVFIGPPADAIALMGNKAQAKRRMIDAGVPCVPGYQGEDQSDETLANEAETIGFPVMVKAAAGGGGRGMRLVEKADAFAGAVHAARTEAKHAFGSDELILEKAILRPRHVEIQVFADIKGNVIHLGERDCSVQRRHQKVIEEAPCPVMTKELRGKMGAAAVEAARSIGYRGAGTVEFLLDGDGAFYFLEMNTRLQVEHPVTELVTGLDLVALQIQVARGEPLGLTQDEIELSGHAIEARIYAEDPSQDFLPCTGTVETWRPAQGEGIRVDGGIETGTEISPFYDPMIAKMIAHGPTRDVARRRLVSALKKTSLFGLQSNIRFLIEVLEEPDFADGKATTAFISESFGDDGPSASEPDFEDFAAAAVLNYRFDRDAAAAGAIAVPEQLLGWSSSAKLSTPYHFAGSDREFQLEVAAIGTSQYEVTCDERSAVVDTDDGAQLTVNGRRMTAFAAHPRPGLLDINIDGRTYRLRNLVGLSALEEGETDGGRVLAPMHGRIVDVFVEPGQAVEAGTRLLVLEAMKMQHEIVAEVPGTIAQIVCSPEDQVGADDLLIEIESDESQEE